MSANAVRRIASAEPAESALAALFVDERDRDVPGVVIPRPEVHLVVRFGPLVPSGLDVHALGGLHRVRRKILRNGQRFVTARLQLGAVEAVLGAPAAALAGQVVALEDLWGSVTARRLVERLAGAPSTLDAAAILERAIAERFASAGRHGGRSRIALDAAEQLTSGQANVNAVALALGVSERHLRRVFRDLVGMSPKAFAQLTRFRRAVRAARHAQHENWAAIAAAAGYYDQAHLIAEFRAIAGVTPRALLGELRVARAIG